MSQVHGPLADLARRLSTEGSREGVARRALEAALAVPGIDGGGVYLHDAATAQLEVVVHEGLSATFIARVQRYGADTMQMALVQAGTPMFLAGDLGGLDAVLREEGLTALAVLPVVHEQELHAVINLASRTLPLFDDATQATLRTLAALAGEVMARTPRRAR